MQMKRSEEVHLSFASLEQQNTFILENIGRIEEETEKLEEERREVDTNTGNASEEILEKEAKIKELRMAIENSGELFAEIQEEIKNQVAKREELNQKNKDFLGKRDEVSKHIADLDKECLRLNNRKESYEEASDRQINYMWDEYEIGRAHV